MSSYRLLADTMASGDEAVPWGLWLMVLQAGVMGVALAVGLSRSHWRMGGALARGARLLTGGMILFAVGHITAFLLSLFVPGLAPGVIFVIHHGAALAALVCIAIGFGFLRDINICATTTASPAPIRNSQENMNKTKFSGNSRGSSRRGCSWFRVFMTRFGSILRSRHW